MGQLTTAQAAQYGSQLTGLPVALVQALIQEEGTINNGHNNPFDVTQYWASLWGRTAISGPNNQILQTGYLPGQGWGSQSGGNPNNPSGIATFTDTSSAVEAWANGINSDPNYATLRQVLSFSGSDITALVKSFPSGYSGGSPTWANNIISIANSLISQGVSNQGAMGTNPIQSASTGTTSGGIEIANPVQAVTNAATNLTDPVVNAVNNLANVLGTGVNNVGQSLAQITAVGQFLGQPHFVERILLLLGGGALLIIGLVLFALSFVKTPSVQVGM